jgi:hypothetical protein
MFFDTPTKKDKPSWSLLSVSLICLSAFALTACGGSSSNDDDHDSETDVEVDSAGRIALYNAADSEISVLDLDTNTISASFPVDGGSPAVYASASKRYAVLVQRTDGQVSFLDSGLYVEDHGDHLHEYKEDPAMEATTLLGASPTHVTEHEGSIAVFYDGNADEGIVSSVEVYDDADIVTGVPSFSLTLDNNMHGVAKQADDALFVTYRDPSITETTLPAAVDRYSVDGDTVTWGHRYTEPCPVLHGSAQNEEYVMFGCGDGLLSISLEEEGYPATKIANPEGMAEGGRVGGIYSHHDLDAFVGVAGNQLFVFDASGEEVPFELMLKEGEKRVDQGYTSNGEWFYVAADSGTLYLFSVEGNFFPMTVKPFDTAYPEGVSGRLVTQSGDGESLYMLDPTGTQLVEISPDAQSVVNSTDLGFVGTYPTWLGLVEEGEHDHDH